MKFRIEESELLEKEHYPVKVLFDMVSNERFKKVVSCVCKGIGFGENYGACVFWNDLDEYDKMNTKEYRGAEFGLHNGDEVLINPKEIFYYLNIICKKYCETYPNEKDEIMHILKEYRMMNHI